MADGLGPGAPAPSHGETPHRLSPLGQEGPFRDGQAGCLAPHRPQPGTGSERKHISRGPQEHKQAWGFPWELSQPRVSPVSWPGAILGLEPGHKSFLQHRLVSLLSRVPGCPAPRAPLGSNAARTLSPPAPGALIPAPFLPLWQDRHPLSWAIAGLRGSKTGGQKVEPLERHKPRSGQDTTSGRRGPRPALAVQTLRNTHGGFLLNLPVNCTSNAQVHLEPVLSKSQTPYHFPHKYFRAQMGLSISRC